MLTQVIRNKALWSGVLLAALVLGCQGDQAKSSSAHSTTAESAHAHWSYEGATGPAHWGSLSPDYERCATGRRQSPINIVGAAPKDLPNVVFRYQPVPVDIVNNGHTVQVNYAPGSAIELDGAPYELVQFHFHAPSEHTIDGRHAVAEMHLVHKSVAGRLAVVGVLLEEGAHHAAFDPVWRHLPAEVGPAVKFGDAVNAADLLPADQRTFRYDGSLTTPPGSEEVRWCLMTEPVRLSKEQLAAFTKIHHGNNRPPQSLNDRVVERDTSK